MKPKTAQTVFPFRRDWLKSALKQIRSLCALMTESGC